MPSYWHTWLFFYFKFILVFTKAAVYGFYNNRGFWRGIPRLVFHQDLIPQS